MHALIYNIISMCLGPAVVPPTEKAKTYVKGIQILLFMQAIVSALNFVAAANFLREAIFGIFFFFLLYIIQHQLSYQVIMIFTFISIFFAIDFMVFFLTPIQNQTDFAQYRGMDRFSYATSIFSFLYYSFCTVFCFYPYREFKSIAFSKNPALKNYFSNPEPESQEEHNRNRDNKTVNYDVNYGNIEYDERRRNNDNGTFEVFQGQGLRIG